MKFAQLNMAASMLNIDFALGYKTTDDIEAQALFSTIASDHQAKVQRALNLYGVSGKIKELENQVMSSAAVVELSNGGFVQMKEGDQKITFKMRPFDLYLSYFFGLSPRHKHYQLVRFYLSFSPFFELLVFNDGLERLNSKKNQ